jgi:hypothetical protein
MSARGPSSYSPVSADSEPAWPAGTTIIAIENLEGLLLLPAKITGRGDRDTSGLLALDTGAGYLALDRALARWAGISDSVGDEQAIGLANRPLQRLSLGDWDLDQVSPVMTVNGEIVRNVTDRNVFGVLGQRPLANLAVIVDTPRDRIALVPVQSHDEGHRDYTDQERIVASRAGLAQLFSRTAVPLTFRLVGDGKILVRARVGESGTKGRVLTLLLDTGATKSVLFEPSLSKQVPESRQWRSVRGLAAPTLIGSADASIALVPRLALEGADHPITVRDVDVAVLRSELSEQLSRVTGEHVDGLLGGSFLWRFRIAIDYPNRVLWFEPDPTWKNPRPYEYCHVGLQLERRGGALSAVGIARGSPAEQAGIRRGDELTEINGKAIEELELSVINRRLEGPPGTVIAIGMRRGGKVTRYHLTRRRLL